MKLEYRESDYFNELDLYLIKTNFDRYYITECHWYNGSWYSDVSLKYKMTSVLAVSCAEIKNKEVTYKNTTLRGKMTKFIEPDGIGVNWYQGEDYRKYGLPNYWNKFENLEL